MGGAMRKTIAGVLIVVAVCCVFSEMTYSASWVQSQNQGLTVRHPQGWKVFWAENGVTVADPQNQAVWCEVRTHKGSGSSQQFTYSMLDGIKSKVQDLRVLQEKQFDRNPDVFGVKFSYRSNGAPVGSVILTATRDGKEFTTRSYAAPAPVYDQAKLTLIPILLTYSQRGGAAAGETGGGMQVLQAPQGSWSYKVPAGWQLVDLGHPNNETVFSSIKGPKGEFIGARCDSGNSINFQLQLHKYGGSPPQDLYQREQFNRSLKIPYLSAADLLQHLIDPFYRTMTPDRQLTNVQPASIDLVRFSATLTVDGHKYIEEGVLKNSSMPCTGAQDDLNLFTLHYVASPAETFSRVKNQLWQIASSFEASQRFGTVALPQVLQICANMRQQNIQALSNMAMNNIRTNQNIMRNTVGTTMKMAEQRQQEGDAWIRVFSGTEIARDPATGQRYEVPVGGQYIYGNDAAGRVIRSDRPLTLNELPTGFRQLESVGLY
jgi:hypothetical protein